MAAIPPAQELRQILSSVPEHTYLTGLHFEIRGKLELPKEVLHVVALLAGAMPGWHFQVGIASPREVKAFELRGQHRSDDYIIISEGEFLRLAAYPCPTDTTPSPAAIRAVLGRT